MKILLSPSKTMVSRRDSVLPFTTPQYLEETKQLLNWLNSNSREVLGKVWNCNSKIAEENMERLKKMNLSESLTPALFSYDGAVYKHIQADCLSVGQLDYLQTNLRILSAFYGILKPLDGITPYRLDMDNKIRMATKGMEYIGYASDLYSFWGRKLYESACEASEVIINLASKEYSKCIEKYLTTKNKYLTVTFCERVEDKLISKGMYAKIARGEMVRFTAENNVQTPEGLKQYNYGGYRFSEKDSCDGEFLFIR